MVPLCAPPSARAERRCRSPRGDEPRRIRTTSSRRRVSVRTSPPSSATRAWPRRWRRAATIIASGLEAVLGAGTAGRGDADAPRSRVAGARLGGRKVRLTAHPLAAHRQRPHPARCRQRHPVLRRPAVRRPGAGADGSVSRLAAGAGGSESGHVTRARPMRARHGRSVDWPAGAADLERYLRTLVLETRVAVRDNIGIEPPCSASAPANAGAGRCSTTITG